MKKRIISCLLSAALCLSVLTVQGEVFDTVNNSNNRKISKDSRFTISNPGDDENENMSIGITTSGRERDIKVIVVTKKRNYN